MTTVRRNKSDHGVILRKELSTGGCEYYIIILIIIILYNVENFVATNTMTAFIDYRIITMI